MLDCNLIFIPIIFENHFSCIAINFSNHSIDYLDNRLYALYNGKHKEHGFDEHYTGFYTIAYHLRDYFGTYLFVKGHSTADWVRQFKIRQIKFDWQSCRTNMDCGVFLLYHCCLYQGKAFKSANLHKASQHRIYRAEICASIVLSDLNIIRSQILSSIDDFNKNRTAIQASVIQHEQEKIKKEKMEKELLEAEEKRAKN
ncbi:Sentrin-specific protease 5 [Bienertia sinuspersici]